MHPEEFCLVRVCECVYTEYMRVRPFDEQVCRLAALVPSCGALFAATAAAVGVWDMPCNVRVRIDVDMYKCTVAEEYLDYSAEPWAGSGPGQVTSQATRRALTCGSRADRPGTDAPGVRCQVLLLPAAAVFQLPARARAFVRSFVPR